MVSDRFWSTNLLSVEGAHVSFSHNPIHFYSWFATMWHVEGQCHVIFSQRIYMKIEFSSQRREMLLFLTTNMAAVTSRANQQLSLLHYYSFKLFLQFWLAKSTCIIHHNQLLMTKFGTILCSTRKWRQKCSPLQVKAPLLRRPGDEVELFWLWKKKMAEISIVSRARTTAGTRQNNSWKQGKNSLGG